MLQPVGGMDAIARAFARALGTTIKLQAEVVGIRRAGERARVSWRDRRTGSEHTLDADFVVCTIPLPVLKGIESDFPERVKRAIAVGADAYIPAVKVAFQANRRWWETDRQIYGGISWTGRDITQVWYPSAGLNGDKGILHRRLHLDDLDRQALRGDDAPAAAGGRSRRWRAAAPGVRGPGRPRACPSPGRRCPSREAGGWTGAIPRGAPPIPHLLDGHGPSPLRRGAHELHGQLAGGRGALRARGRRANRRARPRAEPLSAGPRRETAQLAA